MRGQVIAFFPANIVDFLRCPYYIEIERTALDGEVDLDEVAKVLTGDDNVQWPNNNRLQLTQLY